MNNKTRCLFIKYLLNWSKVAQEYVNVFYDTWYFPKYKNQYAELLSNSIIYEVRREFMWVAGLKPHTRLWVRSFAPTCVISYTSSASATVLNLVTKSFVTLILQPFPAIKRHNTFKHTAFFR